MSTTYQVRIRGRLSQGLMAEFEQLGLVAEAEQAETQFHGPLVDQAALFGLVRRIESLGLELVELRRCPPPSRPLPDRSG